MKRLKKVIFWCHLITGATAGIIVLIMSVTGVLLTYERQITNWADTRSYDVSPPSQTTKHLSVDILLTRLAESRSDPASSVSLRSEPNAPAVIGFQGGATVFMNPYTGAVLGEGAPKVRAFFRGVEDWHRWLGSRSENRNVARAVTGVCNLGFLFLVTSGFYLWWPSKWTRPSLRNVVWFKRGLSPRARYFNWHNATGFWCAIPLFIIVLSGVVMSYTWAGNLVYRLAGETPPPPRAAQPQPSGTAGQQRNAAKNRDLTKTLAGVDALWLRAEQQTTGWKTISLQLPTSAETPLTFSIDQGSGGQPQKRAQLTLDRKTGDVIRWEPFSSLSRGRRFRSYFRFAHTGEVAGIAGQSIAGLASIGATVLVWSGLSLAWRRLRSWKIKREGKTSIDDQYTDIATESSIG